jgi:peptidoglycan hydrolase-like protein with peptidoglycan-binding domain
MRKQLVSALLATLFSVVPLAAQNSQVRSVQQALKDKGYDPGPIDGLYGPRTRAALRDYQEHEHLSASGKMDAKTLNSLGVQATPAEEFHSAANSSHEYAQGGKQIAHGSKALVKDTAHGYVGQGAKTFGKDVAHGAEDIGKGTAHAAEDVGKGVKDSITEKPKKTNTTTEQ